MRIQAIQSHGAHRGGNEIQRAIEASGHRLTRVTVVDPKPGRAELIGKRYRTLGADVVTYEEPLDAVQDRLDPDEPAILTIDDLPAMARAAARKRRGPMLAQGVFMAPVEDNAEFGASIGGISLPMFAERPEDARKAAEFLVTIAAASPATSSSVMRGHPLDEHRLNATRRTTSRGTVADLLAMPAVIEREHPSSLFVGEVRHELVLARHEGPGGLQGAEQAEEIANDAPRAVALVTPGVRVDLFLVVRGRTRMHVPFVVPGSPSVTRVPVPEWRAREAAARLAADAAMAVGSAVLSAGAAVLVTGASLAGSAASAFEHVDHDNPPAPFRPAPAFTD